MNRCELLTEMDYYNDYFCASCPIKRALVDEGSKTKAHRFCIETCSIGLKLQQIGASLNASVDETKKACTD